MPEARYRLFRRASGMFYQQDTTSGVQVSLRTKDKHAAHEKLRAANESLAQPHLILTLRGFICVPMTPRSASALGLRS